MSQAQGRAPEVSFSSLVLTLSTSAWVAMGKVADPLTGEAKKDLDGARYTIDLLIMLREKTRGNLNDEEQKFLNAVIGELQANYAETVFAEKQEEKQEEKQNEKQQGKQEEERSGDRDTEPGQGAQQQED
ncbi:MAG: DUF1844 domain-containing protein [Spirochaetota bacterium]